MNLETCTLFDLLRSRNANLETRKPSFFFHTDRITRLREVFLSTAIDILSTEPEARILWVSPTDSSTDPPGYQSLLQTLSSTGRFSVVSGAEIHAELKRLLQKTDSSWPLPHLCIFAEDADRCMPLDALRLLPELLDTGFGKTLRVFVSMKLPNPLPAHHPLNPFIFLPQVFPFYLHRNTLHVYGDTATLLVPSGDVRTMVRQFLKAEKERKREEKRKARKSRKNRPTPTQIILAVTAVLLALIASRLGG